MPNCAKCKKDFPNRQVINDKIKVLNSRKYCLECSPWGKHNTTQIHKESKIVKEIKNCYLCNENLPVSDFCSFYIKNRIKRVYSYCKKCDSRRVRENSRKVKEWAISQKGGCCFECGYNKCIAALDFHHKNENEKDTGIAKFKKIDDTLKKEIDKCILLCSNCHREKHFIKEN